VAHLHAACDAVYENRKTCDSVLAREMSSRQTEMVSDRSMRVRAAGKDWLVVTPTVAKLGESYSMSFNYNCLPDTVDPRGPKGK
jgi:hypothetical protein